MKVLFLGNPNKSHVRRWAGYLTDQGVSVSILGDAAAPPDFDSRISVYTPEWSFLQNLITYKIRGGAFATTRDKWRVYRPIVRKLRPDILHAHEALTYGPVLDRFPDYPRVLTPWGPDMETLGDGGSGEARFVLRAARAADVITTNAPGMEAHWSQLTGLPDDRFDLFSWGVDTEIFRGRSLEEQEALRLRLGIPAVVPVVLSPRLAKPLYRIPMLIDAWALARENAPPESRFANAVFVVLRAGASDGDWKEIEQKAGEVGGGILLVDEHLKLGEMATLYSTSSAVLMAPQTDLLAMSLLEAMACGALPIVCDSPCYRAALDQPGEASENRGVALICEPSVAAFAKALARWSLLDQETHAGIADHNRRYVERHQNRDVCSARMIEIYRRLLEK